MTMSWHSDRERFDEYDPPYCRRCKGGNSKEECDRCIRTKEVRYFDEDDKVWKIGEVIVDEID